MRSRIVLAAADGGTNTELAERLGLSITTVRRWRNRFVVDRLDGLLDEPRPGRPRVVGDEQIKALITETLESTPRTWEGSSRLHRRCGDAWSGPSSDER
jgi:transposase